MSNRAMNDSADLAARERVTAFHELGHALVAASLGYGSYVDVIHDGAHRGHCFIPEMEIAPLGATALRRLGGGVGEYLTVDPSGDEKGLISRLLHPDRSASGLGTDLRTLRAEIEDELLKEGRSNEGASPDIESRFNAYIELAARYASTVLYQGIWRDHFDAFAVQLVEWRSARIRIRNVDAVLQRSDPLDERAAELAWSSGVWKTT